LAVPWTAIKTIWTRLTKAWGKDREAADDFNCSSSSFARRIGAFGLPMLMGILLLFERLPMNVNSAHSFYAGIDQVLTLVGQANVGLDRQGFSAQPP
jgi:hypothetical protein